MDFEEVAARLRGANRLISPEAVQLILAQPEPEETIRKIITSGTELVVSPQRVQEVIDEEAQAGKARQVVVKGSLTFVAPAKEVDAQVRLDSDSDVTGKSRCTGSVEDFVAYFRDRFSRENRVLRARSAGSGGEVDVLPISKLKDHTTRRPVRVVGMVYSKRNTKNGHTLIEIEDEESSVPCLVSKTAAATLKAEVENVLLDEVIAFEGRPYNDLFIVEQVIWPDIPQRERKTVEDDVSIAFISDLHVGSKYFLQDTFTDFLKFLSGEGPHADQQDVAGKIKYITIAGDLVDGVGIYPSQEKELVTKDVHTQYEIFCEFMKNIPEHIHVVISPGNHDAVRGAQPQPRLAREYTKDLEGYSNMHFVGSPSTFSLHGFKTLIYHGDSAFSLIGALPSLSGAYTSPEKIAIEWLRRRHLSPLYGENPIVPERKDYLFINEAPDILHFGHLHRNGYAAYHGTTIVNSGAWQGVTDYQLRQGFVPTPGKLPILNLRSGNLSVLSFT
jgi:DNA polymerase II small subunit